MRARLNTGVFFGVVKLVSAAAGKTRQMVHVPGRVLLGLVILRDRVTTQLYTQRTGSVLPT